MTLNSVQDTSVSQAFYASPERGGGGRRISFAHAPTSKAPVQAAPFPSSSLAWLLNAMDKVVQSAPMVVQHYLGVAGRCERKISRATDLDQLYDANTFSILKRTEAAKPSPRTSKTYTWKSDTGLRLSAHEAWRLLDGLDMVDGVKKVHVDKAREFAKHAQWANKSIGLDKLAQQLDSRLCSVNVKQGYKGALNEYSGTLVVTGTDRDGERKAILCRYEMKRSALRWQVHQNGQRTLGYVELGEGWETHHYDGKEMKRFEEFMSRPGDIAAKFDASRIIIPLDDLDLLDAALRRDG
ncbi:hypothetical protein [Noviherbaspirillum saxi]|uniref:Uncharacterized protein n=1 Tax=Noviherbaspirillum saxi TaxID=2320863 RepID=A0A3A3FLA0_9BURK|nr:hypothetical protein [Noviherbaspirillum saxi]RJF92145.1 hypothetical protein D3871_26240 [Noviherbaspirillum saxi]